MKLCSSSTQILIADNFYLENPPEIKVEFSNILDRSFKVRWTTENIDQKDISHFLVEVWESIVEWGQQRYQVANFDMINPSLRDIHVWREVKPLTRYDVWVWMKDSRGKAIGEAAIAKVMIKNNDTNYLASLDP